MMKEQALGVEHTSQKHDDHAFGSDESASQVVQRDGDTRFNRGMLHNLCRRSGYTHLCTQAFAQSQNEQ